MEKEKSESRTSTEELDMATVHTVFQAVGVEDDAERDRRVNLYDRLSQRLDERYGHRFVYHVRDRATRIDIWRRGAWGVPGTSPALTLSWSPGRGTWSCRFGWQPTYAGAINLDEESLVEDVMMKMGVLLDHT